MLKKQNNQTSHIKNIWQKIGALLYNYRHGVLLLYAFIYMPWFSYLEQTVTTRFHIIHMVIDDYIPFIEYFIVPYMLWFAYIAVTGAFFFFFEPENFKKFCYFLFTGMTIFLIISTLYPNGTYLRPIVFPRDNIFTDIVKWLYATDTSTNVFPSIHVYNSIVAHWAITQSKRLKDKKVIQISSLILMVSIVVSTVFLKQHSFFDLITGVILSVIVGILVYPPQWLKKLRSEKDTSLQGTKSA